MSKCEFEASCGFYQYLIDQNLIKPDETCGKKVKEKCPRYEYIITEKEWFRQKASQISEVENLHTHQLPISYQETEIVGAKMGFKQKKHL